MKIKIAGAGISGLTAAINLAKSGIDVEIFEAANTIGSRFRGDLQGIENWMNNEDSLEEIKKCGLDIGFKYSVGQDNLQIWTKTKKFKVNSDKPVYYLVERGDVKRSIDRSIYKQAKKLKNIKINFNSPVNDISDIDIVATGPVLRDIKTDAMASGYIFKTGLENQGIILLDDDLAPDAYGYFLVKDGKGVITTCIYREFSKLSSLREKMFQFYMKNIDLKIRGKKRVFSGVGNFFIIKPVSGDNKLYIGEAGGFQDFALGFGMEYAIKTGYLAARSIIEKKDYYQMIKKQIHPFMKASVVNRMIYEKFENRTYVPFAGYVISKNPIRNLKYIYSPRWWHKLLYPIAASIYKTNIQDPIITDA